MTARRTGIVSVATLAALTLLVGVVHCVAPEWSRQLGLDVWNMPTLEAEAVTAARQTDHLNRASDQISRQIAASDQIGQALACGVVSLPEAVKQIMDVNGTRPGFLFSLRHANPTQEDAELLARYALNKVAFVLSHNPARREKTMTQLLQDFTLLTGKAW